VRVVVIGSFAASLVAFRGELLRSIAANGHEVLAIAPEDDEIVRAALGAMGVAYSTVPLHRNGLNPVWDVAVVVALVLLAIGYYGFLPFYTNGTFTFLGDTAAAGPFFTIVGYLIGIGIIAAIVGLVVLLFVRRDLGVAYVAIGGLICGILSALISAPISAVVFGGVTGSGTDFLVAAFQKGGSDLQTAVLQQGLLSDPIDKTLEFFIAFVILQTLSRRFVSRFPQGEKAVGLEQA